MKVSKRSLFLRVGSDVLGAEIDSPDTRQCPQETKPPLFPETKRTVVYLRGALWKAECWRGQGCRWNRWVGSKCRPEKGDRWQSRLACAIASLVFQRACRYRREGISARAVVSKVVDCCNKENENIMSMITLHSDTSKHMQLLQADFEPQQKVLLVLQEYQFYPKPCLCYYTTINMYTSFHHRAISICAFCMATFEIGFER